MNPDSIGNYFVGLCCDGNARFVAVDALAPALEMKSRHGLAGNASVIAAEGMLTALLLSAHVKGDERLTLQIAGETPQFSLVVDVNGDGTTRGRFVPQRLVPGRAFSGTLMVLKSLWQTELYRSVADVKDETLEDALRRFLVTSQQVDSRVWVQAERDRAGNLVFAGGLLVEKLPHADADDFRARLEGDRAPDLKLLMKGLGGIIGGDASIGGSLEILGAQTIRYRCSCGPERVRAILRGLGHEELRTIIDEQGRAEVNCHFCNADYVVEREELEAIVVALAEERPAGEA
ncbi:MAG: hypothetical protein RLZZ299_1528 [Pseudomonadota bacterium]|jgi:molecular chaperone Hsp33